MKLLIVTVVEEFEKKVMELFKEAGIENFSSSDIDGFKNQNGTHVMSSWFPAVSGSNESRMFFSFTDEDKIDGLFRLINIFNTSLESPNPIKAVVVPVEKNVGF